MTLVDGYCDYCRRRVDEMGNDGARRYGEKYWCGACREGRDALFSDLSTVDVLALRERNLQAYEADPSRYTKYHNVEILGAVLKDRGYTE